MAVCECPDLDPGVNCAPMSFCLETRIKTALCDVIASQELICMLRNLCDFANNGTTAPTEAKDVDGANLVTKPNPLPLEAGQPVWVNNMGQALPASFANCPEASVFGVVVEASGAGGAACVAIGGMITIADWTRITGSPSLTPGAQYYLTATGGLSTTPPAAIPGEWNTRVGTACDGQTLIVDPRDPWQL